MIHIDFKNYFRDRVWCGWYYSYIHFRNGGWRYERHESIPFISVFTLKEARRRVREYENNKAKSST